MADEIRGLLATAAALDKLGARAISIQEAEQIPRNTHAVRAIRGAPILLRVAC